MSSITATSTNIQALQEDLRRSQEREYLLQQRVNALEAEMDFLRRLFSNPHISPAAKLVLWTIRCFVLTLRVDHHATTDVHISGKSGLAGQTGLSTDTVGRLIKRFDGLGVLVRGERSDWLEDGNGIVQKRTIVSVALTGLADSPEFIKDSGPKHGGKRVKRCEHCGSDDLWIETSIYCRGCQNRLHHSIEPLNALLEAEIDELSQPLPELAASPEIVIQCGDTEQVASQDGDSELITEPIPIAVQPHRPVMPLHECRFCHVRKWIWSRDDDDWICCQCLSPAEGEVRLL